jgi:Domain of unknown function (DUF5665)
MIKKTEHDARKNLMEELFNDFHRSRRQVYGINFVRGIFFGVGSVIGGTIVVALVLWLLSLLVDLPGGVGDFVQFVVDIVQNRK